MIINVWSVLRGLAGAETGRWCRRCRESIRADDLFGLSESICAPCRERA